MAITYEIKESKTLGDFVAEAASAPGINTPGWRSYDPVTKTWVAGSKHYLANNAINVKDWIAKCYKQHMIDAADNVGKPVEETDGRYIKDNFLRGGVFPAVFMSDDDMRQVAYTLLVGNDSTLSIPMLATHFAESRGLVEEDQFLETVDRLFIQLMTAYQRGYTKADEDDDWMAKIFGTSESKPVSAMAEKAALESAIRDFVTYFGPLSDRCPYGVADWLTHKLDHDMTQHGLVEGGILCQSLLRMITHPSEKLIASYREIYKELLARDAKSLFGGVTDPNEIALRNFIERSMRQWELPL